MSKKDDYSSKDFQMVFEYTEEGGVRKRLVVNNAEKYRMINIEKANGYIKKMERENDRYLDDRGKFVIGKNGHIKELENVGLTLSERSYFMQIILYAQFDGSPLTKNGIPLNNRSIAEIWNVHEDVALRKLKKFVKTGLLFTKKCPEDKRVKNYFLNEDYFWMGSIKNENRFVKLFLTKLNEVIETVKFNEEVALRKAKDISSKKEDGGVTSTPSIDIIGILNAVIPYFHYQTYYLVSNPDDDILLPGEEVVDALERDPKQLKHLTRTEIGRILGYKRADTRTIDQYMDHLQSAGAVMVTKFKNKRHYLIHPDLMFRINGNGLDNYTRHIRNQFNLHK